ncbi:MAG: DUF177 domain-containing protein [Deltaproteobacteria bacterium]|nr:DUF177 domain-containing protein [Deltaproteobacteria bacterium]
MVSAPSGWIFFGSTNKELDFLQAFQKNCKPEILDSKKGLRVDGPPYAMRHEWIQLSAIPAQGREFSFLDEREWDSLFRESSLDIEIAGPFEAIAMVLPQSDGVYVKGRIAGRFRSQCVRCLERAEFRIDESFEFFESFEDWGSGADDGLLRSSGGGWEMDIRAVMWEQFSLALPDRVLCSEDCKGLCGRCGQNLNIEPCGCSSEKGDSRLAVLRGLQMKTDHSDTKDKKR